MNLAQFRTIGDTLARRAKLSKVKVFIGEPRPKEKLYLVYSKFHREFTIEWEDGVQVKSPQLIHKLTPYALTVLASVWESEEKKRRQTYEKRRGQGTTLPANGQGIGDHQNGLR